MGEEPPLEVKLVHAATSNKMRRDMLQKLTESDLDFSALKELFKLTDQMLAYHISILERARLIQVSEKAGFKTVSLTPIVRSFLEGEFGAKPKEVLSRQEIMHVEIASIKQTLPCIADPGKLRVIAELKPELQSKLKTVRSAFKGARYSDKLNVLIFRHGVKLFTIYPNGRLTMTMVENEAEGLRLLEEIKNKINEALAKGAIGIEEEVEAKIATGPLDIYKYLPQTNCRLCGEQSCYVFAVKLSAGEAKLSACEPMREEKYAVHREHLASLLEF